MPAAQSAPLLNAPSPAAHKLELLRALFPQAIETAPDGSVRVNTGEITQRVGCAPSQAVAYPA